MSVTVKLHEYQWDELIKALKDHGATNKPISIETILEKFGFKYGNIYILVDNEHADSYDGNSYFNAAYFIDDYYGLEDTFSEVFCGMDCNWERTLYTSVFAEDVAGELGVELD